MTATRYQCQLHLDEIGANGQAKLAAASVLCIGAGGLAHSALAYLAAAGIGEIGVVDGDLVDESNLQRQILFAPHDIGQNKAHIITQKLSLQNPAISALAYQEFLTEDNADKLVKPYDIVLDCSDNYFTRYLVNDVCYRLTKPDVFAAVVGFTGYVTVFSRDLGPCYRCLHPAPPPLGNVKNCADFGVWGAAAGLFGLLQATEVIKIILNIGKPLYGELLRFDLLNSITRKRKLTKQAECELCGKTAPLNNFREYATFMPAELTTEQAKQNWDQLQFLDVREADEYQHYNLKMPNMPFSILMNDPPTFAQFDKNKPLLVVCAHGVRSKYAAQLCKSAGFKQVYSLKGGLADWQIHEAPCSI